MNRKLIVGLFAVFLLGATQTQAATLYMDPNHAELSRGDTLKVSVRLDTDEDECVNVVDGVIKYSDNIQPVDISRGASILSMWVEEPIIDRSNKTITFAGGIPNGYCGRIAGDPRLTNVVVDLLFQSPGFVIGASGDTNQGQIAFGQQTQVLLNDGFGTLAPLTLLGTSIELSKTPGSSINNEWGDIVNADEIDPEEFSITLERTKNAFSNDYFIVFNTTDKQSGIDHYEVIEESMTEASLFNWGREDAPWKEVKSPYVLKDQTLNSTIRVRAIDKAGNEYVAIYVPDEAQRTMTAEVKVMIALIATGIGIFVLSGFVFTVLFFFRRKSAAETGEDVDSEDELEDEDN
ncbi:MAG: hypothetical protein ACI92I_000057 [Acidimicrobiales bacterium]|jgi:hypothetical protein